jgi:predicted DNA binding CopG/RHH family protein
VDQPLDRQFEWAHDRGSHARSASAQLIQNCTAAVRPTDRKIRLSSKDLEAFQKRALAEGLSYQTLISSLLHKYAAGRLKEL